MIKYFRMTQEGQKRIGAHGNYPVTHVQAHDTEEARMQLSWLHMEFVKKADIAECTKGTWYKYMMERP